MVKKKKRGGLFGRIFGFTLLFGPVGLVQQEINKHLPAGVFGAFTIFSGILTLASGNPWGLATIASGGLGFCKSAGCQYASLGLGLIGAAGALGGGGGAGGVEGVQTAAADYSNIDAIINNFASDAPTMPTITVSAPRLSPISMDEISVLASIIPVGRIAVTGVRVLSALASRAKQIHGILDPIAQTYRTTAVLRTSAGNIVAGGARDLSAAQRAALGPGEIAVRAPGVHAEVTALQGAQQAGSSPQAMAVTREICSSCRQVLEASGAVVDKFTAVWP